MHRIVVVHKKFKSIPANTFFFKDFKTLKKYIIEFKEKNFKIQIRINFKKLSYNEIKIIIDLMIEEDLKETLERCKNKKDLIKEFEVKYGT